jgi:hypothetical protein
LENSGESGLQKANLKERLQEDGKYSHLYRALTLPSLNDHSWHRNPQYGITVPEDTKLFIALTQPDARMSWESEYTVPLGIYVMKTTGNHSEHPFY